MFSGLISLKDEYYGRAATVPVSNSMGVKIIEPLQHLFEKFFDEGFRHSVHSELFFGLEVVQVPTRA